MPMKESKEDLRKMKRHTMFINRKTQCSKDVNFPKLIYSDLSMLLIGHMIKEAERVQKEI